MDFEIYKRKLLEEDERNRLSELQTKYNGIKTPDYANMSLRDELQTRFDLDELNNLQQKYGVQQTSALKSQITASSPQSSYVQPISSQQPNSQPSTWDNTLRKAEQLTTAALDGLSLGWADELEGAASAVGYGLASLNPQWNKTNESFWDAMKRGYVKGRDNRRQVLAQGLQENPTTTTVTQMAGAYASPINLFKYSKTAPLGIQNKLNNYNAAANGIIYGIGSGQDNWQNYAQQIGIGLVGNFAGNRFAAQAFGRAVNPLIRNAFSTAMVIIFLTFSPGLAVATKPATCTPPENPIKITGLLSAIFLIASYSALITSSAKRAVVQCLFEQIGLLIYWYGRAKYMTFWLSSPKASSRTKVPRGVWSCVALPRALKA